MVKVRFAPSPTGNMHIGNLRTAIFNWVFAKKNNGTMFLRLEDTDQKRYHENYEKRIFEIMDKFKLDYTFSFKQSERQEVYKKYADELKQKNKTFFCQCLPENEFCLCEDKHFTTGALKFKINKDQSLSFNDLVLGNCPVVSNQLESFVLLRSDGTPTYMLSVVVDDIETGITHVIRGADHKTNTFKQILLYEAFEKPMPMFAHLPLIIGDDNKKLAKRNGNSSVENLLQNGFSCEGIFNALIRLGWGFKDYEIISRQKLIEIFDFKQIKKSPAKFDEKKLKKFSSYYIKNTNTKEEAKNYLKEYYGFTHDIVDNSYEELSNKSMTYKDMYDYIKFLEKLNFKECLKTAPKPIDQYFYELPASQNHSTILQFSRDFCQRNNLDFKEFCSSLRLFITDSPHSIDIFHIILNIHK